MSRSDTPRTENFIITGVPIYPEPSHSRPSSARSNRSQTVKSPSTIHVEDKTRERPPSASSSVNLSHARQRRLSNSSQRSAQIKNFSFNDNQVSPRSTASGSGTPRPEDAGGFFTDRDGEKSMLIDNGEIKETDKWLDDLHQLNTLSTINGDSIKKPTLPLGMSRDSLNGTLPTMAVPVTRDDRLPTLISIPTNEESLDFSSKVYDSKADEASRKIQVWYRHQRGRLDRNDSLRKRPSESGQSTPRANEIRGPIITSRPPSVSSTTSSSRMRRTPQASPYVSQRRDSTHSGRNSVTSSHNSKVTADELYEKLKELEDVPVFPSQIALKDDSVYLTADSSRTLTRNERNNLELTFVSPRTAEPGTPKRRESFSKISQSVSMPQTRVTTPIKAATGPRKVGEKEQQNRFNVFVECSRTLKSTVVSTPPTSPGEQRRSRTHSTRHENDSLREVPMAYEMTLTSRDTESDFDRRLEYEKQEYDAAIQRHVKFIDHLIEDKEQLRIRYDKLKGEFEKLQKKTNDRLRSLEQFHRLEIQRLKDAHQAAEKLRREQWIAEKTKKFKDLTVRDLQPEIENLIGRHRSEIAQMTNLHQAEILVAEQRSTERHLRLTEELRDQLEREKQEALAREREIAREKYEKAIRDEQQTFAELRRRLFAEINDENTRQAELIGKQRADLEKLRREIEENQRNLVETQKHEYDLRHVEQQTRYEDQIRRMNEQFNEEKQSLREQLLQQQELMIKNREFELRQQLKRERDDEIEKILQEFENNNHSNRDEFEQTADNRVKRIRERYEAECRQLEQSEREMREQLNQMKGKVAEVEGDNHRLANSLKQKEIELVDIKKITDILQNERQRLSEIVRQEFADRLVNTDEENRRIKIEMAELRARTKLEVEKKNNEIETLKTQQDKELETLHLKIKEAITKKDETVQDLRRQYQNAIDRAAHFEQLLAQQRKALTTIPSSTTNSKRTKVPL